MQLAQRQLAHLQRDLTLFSGRLALSNRLTLALVALVALVARVACVDRAGRETHGALLARPGPGPGPGPGLGLELARARARPPRPWRARRSAAPRSGAAAGSSRRAPPA
eukprot:scaffold92624_cov54-Phaeocystis_antarctica.AAC.3